MSSAAIPNAATPRPEAIDPQAAAPWQASAVPAELDAFGPCPQTVEAYARAVGLDQPWYTPEMAAACTAVPTLAPAAAPTPPLGPLGRLQDRCSAALTASWATPARAAVTSGAALLASMALAPGLGLAGTLASLQAIAPYCAAAAVLQWLSHTPEPAAAAQRQRRLAVAAIGLPVGAALGCVAGAALGAVGGALMWAGAGGAAAVTGALMLVNQLAESRVGLALMLLCALLLVAHGAGALL